MMRKVLRILKWVALGVCAFVAVTLVFGLLVRGLWNWLMPPIFGLPVITFWQAWGLVVLTHILVGGGERVRYEAHRHGHRPAPADSGDRPGGGG